MIESRAAQRLLNSIHTNADSGCWEWIGQISNSGYGRTAVRAADGGTRLESAHRVSYEVFVGSVPEGMRVRQTCQNRLCINPEHLELTPLQPDG
jgi:hypothetical protein